ncbi:hypothetical protein Q5P01_025651 [Channa striata]|uniref:Uncharacterized protein n=1 Tax=Channa striata TaxID=64152 RepID=A0AA88INT9_CHASR|nr:hypothetical protein Q5P01_025651 [Channa striata]
MVLDIELRSVKCSSTELYPYSELRSSTCRNGKCTVVDKVDSIFLKLAGRPEVRFLFSPRRRILFKNICVPRRDPRERRSARWSFWRRRNSFSGWTRPPWRSRAAFRERNGHTSGQGPTQTADTMR